MRYGQVPRVWLALLLLIARAYGPAYAKHRTSSDGDVLRPLVIPAYENEKARQMRAELRTFLWTHWHKQRPGSAVITEHSVEEPTKPCTTTYSVSPDRHGKWKIDARWNCKNHPKTGLVVFVSVHRLARDEEGKATNTIVQDTIDLPGTSYILLLQNESGLIRWKL